MTSDQFGEWLLKGDKASPEKIQACLKHAFDQTASLEMRGKASCHLIYRVIDGTWGDPETAIGIGTVGVNASDAAGSNESAFMRSRWKGSLIIATAYVMILKTGEFDRASELLLKMVDMDAISHHPQNVLNIQRALLLIAANNIRKGQLLEYSADLLTQCKAAAKKAVDLIDLDQQWPFVADEMRHWMSAIGVALGLDGYCRPMLTRGQKLLLQRALDFEMKEPFRSAMGRLLLPTPAPYAGPKNRAWLASQFGGESIELGVAAGTFSRMILEGGSCRRLWSIDRWSDHHDVAQYLDATKRLIAIKPGVCVPLRMAFAEAAPLFADGSIDGIYIDGYAGGGQEGGETLRTWWPKLKKGGLFAGHDYHPDFPATIKSVDAFAASHGFEFTVTEEADGYPSWYGRKA